MEIRNTVLILVNEHYCGSSKLDSLRMILEFTNQLKLKVTKNLDWKKQIGVLNFSKGWIPELLLSIAIV